MLRILRTYLAKDLAKIGGLATVVITIMMTFLGVIEPLREQGLSGPQALRLFGYLMPVMFSLTLPVAALFAATFVYGRFSQDNELLASRASGLCTLSLLRPAIWLGAIVSVVTLALSLWVAPQLLGASQKSLKANLRQVAHHQLMTRGYIEPPRSRLLIHADSVNTETNWMHGVIVLNRKDPKDAMALVARAVKPDFIERDGQVFLDFTSKDNYPVRQNGLLLGEQDLMRLRRANLTGPFDDDPQFYDWGRLWRTWTRPRSSESIRRETEVIRQEMCAQQFYRDLIDSINTGGSYSRLTELSGSSSGSKPGWILLQAPHAELDEESEGVVLSSPRASGATNGADVVVLQVHEVDGVMREHKRSVSATVRAKWDDEAQKMVVKLLLKFARVSGSAREAGAGHTTLVRGPYAIPADIIAQSRALRLDEVVEGKAPHDVPPKVEKLIKKLNTETLPRLLRKAAAEMHWRIAYGVCCMLMVMIGAAMGLILRGGQVLGAMAISAVPASVVIVVLLMGKQLIASAGMGQAYGAVVIWAGVAVMAAVTAYIYVVPMRR